VILSPLDGRCRSMAVQLAGLLSEDAVNTARTEWLISRGRREPVPDLRSRTRRDLARQAEPAALSARY
jgi:hypothetical protein